MVQASSHNVAKELHPCLYLCCTFLLDQQLVVRIICFLKPVTLRFHLSPDVFQCQVIEFLPTAVATTLKLLSQALLVTVDLLEDLQNFVQVLTVLVCDLFQVVLDPLELADLVDAAHDHTVVFRSDEALLLCK